MDESKTEKRASVAKWQAAFGWMSFALFIAGLLAFIVGVVLLALGGGGYFADLAIFNSLFAEALAYMSGIFGRRHRFGAIGSIGALIMVSLWLAFILLVVSWSPIRY
jgi:cytochrome b